MGDHRPPFEARGGGRPNLFRRVLSQPVTTVADALVPVVVDAVDLNEAISRVDINGLVSRVDVDVLMSKIDVEALLERIDVEALLRRIDLNAVLQRVDVETLMASLDVDALVRRVDIDGVLERVNVERIAERIDVNALAQRIEVGSLVTRTTGGLVTSFVDLLRRWAVGLDVISMRVLSHRRRRRPAAEGPPLLRHDGVRAGDVSGRYAGPVSRLVAFALDVGVVFASFALMSAIVTWLVQLVFDYKLTGDKGVWWSIAFFAWWFLYLWAGLTLAGRTVGKLCVGLRVVARDGSPATHRSAFIRVLVFPFSILLFGIGLLIALWQPERRALHDLAATTCEVYDWGDRPAEQPPPLTAWLERRGALADDEVPAVPD